MKINHGIFFYFSVTLVILVGNNETKTSDHVTVESSIYPLSAKVKGNNLVLSTMGVGINELNGAERAIVSFNYPDTLSKYRFPDSFTEKSFPCSFIDRQVTTTLPLQRDTLKTSILINPKMRIFDTVGNDVTFAAEHPVLVEPYKVPGWVFLIVVLFLLISAAVIALWLWRILRKFLLHRSREIESIPQPRTLNFNDIIIPLEEEIVPKPQSETQPLSFWANEISDLKAKLRLLNQQHAEFNEKLASLNSVVEEVNSMKQQLENLNSEIDNWKQNFSEKFTEAIKSTPSQGVDIHQIVEAVVKELEPRLTAVEKLQSATPRPTASSLLTDESKKWFHTEIDQRLMKLREEQNKQHDNLKVWLKQELVHEKAKPGKHKGAIKFIETVSETPPSTMPVIDTLAQLLGEAATAEVVAGPGEYFVRLIQLQEHLSSWLNQIGKSWKASIVHVVTVSDGLEVHTLNIEAVNHHRKVTCTKCGPITETLHVQCFVAVTSESAPDCYVLIPKGDCVAQEYPAVYNQLVETNLETIGNINLIKQAGVLHPVPDGGKTRYIIKQKIVVQ